MVRVAAARIGADASADVVVAEPSVAALHAALRLQGGVWMLEDLGSDAGSWVDEIAITEPQPVAPGSVVRLGAVEVIFDPQDVWADSPPDASTSHVSDADVARSTPIPLFTIERASTGPGWLPWALVGAVVILAIAAVLLAGGSR